MPTCIYMYMYWCRQRSHLVAWSCYNNATFELDTLTSNSNLTLSRPDLLSFIKGRYHSAYTQRHYRFNAFMISEKLMCDVCCRLDLGNNLKIDCRLKAHFNQLILFTQIVHGASCSIFSHLNKASLVNCMTRGTKFWTTANSPLVRKCTMEDLSLSEIRDIATLVSASWNAL